jgi:hypothetical protein
MKRRTLILLLLAPLVAGCPPEIIPLRSQASVERSYEIGQARRAAPGETLVVVRRLTSAPQYEIAFDYTPPQHDMLMGGMDYPPLRKGMRFVQVATRGDGAIGLERGGYGVTRPGSITNRETYRAVTIWISKEGIVSGSMEGKRWTGEMLFLPIASPPTPVEATRTEIVLDGVDGSMINATLREYEGGAAAASTGRPLRFDTAVSTTIEAAGITIEVLSATPAGLEYRVVSDDTSE